jgi:hypothetical protein
VGRGAAVVAVVATATVVVGASVVAVVGGGATVVVVATSIVDTGDITAYVSPDDDPAATAVVAPLSSRSGKSAGSSASVMAMFTIIQTRRTELLTGPYSRGSKRTHRR